MLATQGVIDGLAGRIERAYRRRRLGWHGACSTPRVWAIAAETLLLAHNDDGDLPLDPELFVAAQPFDAVFIDPWRELTRPESVDRYAGRVREIVCRLADELADEVGHAEGRIVRGESIGKVLLSRSRKLSALGRYIVALRAGRPALARRFVHGALEQHRACPLYRVASHGLLADDLYPTPDPRGSQAELPAAPARPLGQVHLN